MYTKYQFCEKTFSFSTNMKKHISIVHDKKKPFSCEICDGSFLSRYDLERHFSKVHEGNKDPFRCYKCNSAFASKGKLKSHIEADHEGKKPFEK